MGSSKSNKMNGEIDASVGGLVWVRRRNGSWWPGRIMGLDELSESCLVSPRSGTPVKLLGREDASVDWYNLEKSKRVKAFRCGEYDECIEKAKVSAANSSKKAVKYARREDAILHALELESAHLDKEPIKLCSRSDKSGSENGGSVGELPVMSNPGDDNGDDRSYSEDNSNSAPELSQSGISFEEPNHNGPLKMQSVQGRRRRTPNDSEDDGSEGVKRMRGLEDLGIGVVAKRKVQGTGASATEIVQHVSGSLGNSTAGSILENGTSVNGGKCYSSTLKRKRSQVANVHEFLKRKNRRRPLTKVLESTAMVSVPVICDQLPSSSNSPLGGMTDGMISGLDSNDPKKNVPITAHSSNNNTGVACENGISSDVHDHGSESTQINNRVKENDIPCTSGLVGNDSSDKLFDVPFVGDLGEEKHTQGFSPALVSCSAGKHQSCHGSPDDVPSLRNEGQNESGCTISAAGHNIIGHRTEKGSSKWQSKGKRNLRYRSKNRKHVSRKFVGADHESSAYLPGMEKSDGFSQGNGQKVDWNNMIPQAKCKPVVEDKLDGFWDLNKHTRGTMAETKLLPDGSHKPQRSLPHRQSRFTVNSRYQMADFPGRNYCSDDSLYDVKVEVKSSYRPQHVPLVSLVSKLNGKAFIGHPLTVEVLENGYCDEAVNGVGCDLEASGIYHTAKPSSISRRKSSKKKSNSKSKKSAKRRKIGLLNKKIRKLSSLTGLRQSEVDRKPVVDKLKGPVIACIPLKVVFSRINEAVSGQARSTHRALPTTSNL